MINGEQVLNITELFPGPVTVPLKTKYKSLKLYKLGFTILVAKSIAFEFFMYYLIDQFSRFIFLSFSCPLYMKMSQNINKTTRHLKFSYISILTNLLRTYIDIDIDIG